jgi:uncharacterized OsmC-like protein
MEQFALGTVASRQVMQVRSLGGAAYEVAVRDHRVTVDQPVPDGGQDAAPTPTELFVASLATCIAYYAGQYLSRHGLAGQEVSVRVDWAMATDRPARVSDVRLTVRVPAQLPPARRDALLAVVSHCTVHNSLTNPPHVDIELT